MASSRSRHAHSAPPGRPRSVKASPYRRSAPPFCVAAMTSPRRAEWSSPTPHTDSVRVFAMMDSNLEFVAELGRTAESHHAAEAGDQAPTQSEGPGEVILAFCSEGGIRGVAYLVPDAPRYVSGGDDDDEGDDGDGIEDDVLDAASTDDDDDDASTYAATDESSNNASSYDEGDDEEAKDQEDSEDEGDYDWGDEDASIYTVTCESSNNGSSNDEGNDDEAAEDDDDYSCDWEADYAKKQETISVPTYTLKLKVLQSCAYANIVLFDGLEWISTISYSVRLLSRREAEVIIEKLAKLSQMDMKVDPPVLVSNAMLLKRSEYEGPMVNSSAVEMFVRYKLSPSFYNFSDQKLIGKGAYSNVRLCTSLFDKKDYDIKIIKIEKYDPSEPREVSIFSSLRSKYVVKFIQAWTENHIFVDYEECSEDDSRESPKGRKGQTDQQPKYVLIHMEFCPGSLENYLCPKSRKIDTAESLRMFNELVHGLQYIHGENVVHHDIKPANIFMGNDGTIKLGDFGQSCVRPWHGGVFKTTPNLGTAYYEAPELKKAEDISEKVDVYSAGVTCLELVHIFETGAEKVAAIKHYQSDNGSNTDWDQGDFWLVKRMVAYDPLERISVDDIVDYISKL